MCKKCCSREIVGDFDSEDMVLAKNKRDASRKLRRN
jgi:hypothetical protein